MPARPPACRPTPCPTGSTSRPILFFLTRRIEYFRTAAPSRRSQIRENQKRLIIKYIRATHHRMDAPKRDFRHYMTRFGAIFPLKSGLGSKFPWDGSAIPWDGNRNPWDGSTVQPHGSTKTTLKGGRRSLSALTLCHIAHSASPAERCPPRRDAIRRVSHRPDGLGGAAFLPPTARGKAQPRHYFPPRCERYYGGAAPRT